MKIVTIFIWNFIACHNNKIYDYWVFIIELRTK